MALSGIINGTCYSYNGSSTSKYNYKIEWSATQNVSANTSTITARAYLQSTSSSISTVSSNWVSKINGSQVWSGSATVSGSWVGMGSRSWTVNHNSDGTCTTNISGELTNGITYQDVYVIKKASASANVTLNTIPRGSTFTLNRSSATLGTDAITLNITRASSSYTHKVQFYFGSHSGLLAEGVGTSYTFTPNISLSSQVPNSTSGTATIKIQTMNGNTWIAETSKTITLNVPSSVVPTISSVTATGNNLLGGVYVAGKSTVTAKINGASGAYSSTIKSYNISGAGISSSASSATSGTLGAGDYTITGKVTDSRGRTASKSTKITVHSYYAPSVAINLYRCDSGGNKNDSGTYARVAITPNIVNVGNANVNAKQYQVQWKKASDSNWSTLKDWTDLSSYNSTFTCDLGEGWDNTITYNVKINVKDSYSTVSATGTISTISCILNIEQRGIGIGKTHEQGTLDIGGKVYASDSILTENNFQVGKNKKVYGLTSDGTQISMVGVASHNGIDVGSSSANTAVCSANQPTWWNGSTSRHLVYSENDSSGYPAIISNGGNNWIRTPSSGLIPHTSGTGSGRSDIGSDGWRFSTGYFNNVEASSIMYTGRNGSDFGGGFVARRYLNNKQQSAKCMIINTGGGCASILHRDETNGWEVQFLVQAWSAGTGCVRPNNNGGIENGTSAYKWKVVYASNGTIQTSDERFKVKRGFTDTEDCFEMIRNTNLYNYIMLDKNKEDLTQKQLGRMAAANNEEDTKLHIGVMAQDIQNYKCGKQILIEGQYQKENGEEDTMLHVNPYDMTMAVMGALQEEIKRREALEDRVAKLEAMVEKLMNQN